MSVEVYSSHRRPYLSPASLLTQQTVLGFSSHPPSPFGAGRLPRCVTEERGGQDSFAMNRHTQLQFNLGIPPSPSNLATHFDPSHPTPIVINKPTMVTGDRFKVISAKKLALAVHLARRDLKLGRYPPTSPHLCHTCRTEQTKQDFCQACQNEQTVPQCSCYLSTGQPLEKDRSVFSTVHCDKCDPSMLVSPSPSHDKSCARLEERGTWAQQTLHHRSSQPHFDEKSAAVAEDELSLVGKDGNLRGESGEDRSSKEVVRLRKELQKQVAYLRQLRELGRGNVVLAQQDMASRKRGRRAESGPGRVWMEEVKGEEDKLLQRREEQSVRNGRLIYNLSQRVSSLQQDWQKLQLVGTTSSSKKSQAMQRLAAVYRAALRLLQNYGSGGHAHESLPPELGLLLQQLSLLAHHFGVGGANYELEAIIKNLKELIEGQKRDKASVLRQSSKENVVSQRTAAVKKKASKVQSSKKTNVLLYPKHQSQSFRRGRGQGRRLAGPPHFAQQTLSSQIKRQPPPPPQRFPWQRPQQYSPIKVSPSLLHSSTPVVVQRETETERQSDKKREPEDTKENQENPVANVPAAHLTEPRHFERVTSSACSTHSSATVEQRIHVASPHGEERTVSASSRSPRGEQRLWMESVCASLAHQSQQLETFKRSTEQQLSHLQQKLSSKLKREEEVASPAQSDTGSPPDEGEDPTRYREKLEGLVERLRELEGEEEVIRERWRTITYEDPPLARHQVVQCSKEKMSRKSVSDETPPSSIATETPPPSISAESQERIAGYRQQFQHHLKLTGHNTQGGFNPWKMAENIADDLLSEVVDQVVEELGQLCDGYIDRLYSSEFVPPTTSPT